MFFRALIIRETGEVLAAGVDEFGQHPIYNSDIHDIVDCASGSAVWVGQPCWFWQDDGALHTTQEP